MPRDDHHDTGTPPGPPSARAVPRDVRRAVAHMRAGLARRITTAELARVGGVPERTLQKHFRAFLGTPPLAHLRAMRLAAARAALLAPEGGASVTEVAARCGFAHPGRFAAEYARRFGEPPSATLARGRAAADERGAAAAAAVAPRRASGTSDEGPPARPSLRRHAAPLAVLPFRAEPGRLEERLLAEALTEQLAAALSRARAVAVRVAAAVPGEPGRAARGLGEGYCLTGRVARSPDGARARVVVRLLDLAAGGEHLWGDAYDGDAADPFGLQDRVAEGVALAVPPSVQGAEVERARRTPERDLGARGLVLRALPLALAADPTSARRALGPLEEAMGLDPDDPAPVALAGWCRAQLVFYHAPDPAAERARALRLAERAAALDGPPGDPLVLTARGGVAMMAGARHDAEALGARALAMDPGSAWAWERSAWLRGYAGEPEAALGEFRRALRLKGPREPTANCLAGIGCAHLSAGRPGEAASWFRRALLENPGAAWLNRLLAPCHLRLGDLPAARAALDGLRRAHPGTTMSAILGVIPRVDDGRRREVHARLAEDWARLGLRA